MILESCSEASRDRASVLNFLLVLVSVAGVALVSVSDAQGESTHGERRAGGDLVAVLRCGLHLFNPLWDAYVLARVQAPSQ